MKEYIKNGDQLLEINQNRQEENLIKPVRSLSAPSPESRKNDPDGLGLLVGEMAPEHCCLVFCSTKKNCESVAKLISRNLSATLLQFKVEEKLKLGRELEVHHEIMFIGE